MRLGVSAQHFTKVCRLVAQSQVSFLFLARCLQLHVDLTFRLRFGIRKSMHQLEAMPAASHGTDYKPRYF